MSETKRKASAAKSAGKVEDTVFFNGRITADSASAEYSWMRIGADGRIIKLGRGSKPPKDALQDAKQIDLEGKRVLPGLIDVSTLRCARCFHSARSHQAPRTAQAHIHVCALGKSLSTADVLGSGSIGELQRRLREYVAAKGVAARPKTEWVQVRRESLLPIWLLLCCCVNGSCRTPRLFG